MFKKLLARQRMKQAKKLLCSEGCKKPFPREKIELKKKVVGTFRDERATLYYFNCPNCGKQYDSYYMTRSIEKAIKREETNKALSLQAEIKNFFKHPEVV